MSQFSETASGLRYKERDFEALLEIFSTLFCKNCVESPWKRNIFKKQECHVRERFQMVVSSKVATKSFELPFLFS